MLALLTACTQQSDNAPITNPHDACAPPSLTPMPSATSLQLDGIAGAEALWRARGAPELGVHAGDPVEILFQHAAPEFFGLYDDQASVIYVNEDVTDPTVLSIVIAHEVGHAFGLVHVSPDQRASVMNPGNTVVPPTDDDQRALEALWGICP